MLNDEQVMHWRFVLVGMIGPYALIAPREEIQAIRDKMQSGLDVKRPVQDEVCSCDPVKNGTTTYLDGRIICNKCRKPRH